MVLNQCHIFSEPIFSGIILIHICWKKNKTLKLHVVHQPYTEIDRKKGITGGDHQTISNVKV